MDGSVMYELWYVVIHAGVNFYISFCGGSSTLMCDRKLLWVWRISPPSPTTSQPPTCDLRNKSREQLCGPKSYSGGGRGGKAFDREQSRWSGVSINVIPWFSSRARWLIIYMKKSLIERLYNDVIQCKSFTGRDWVSWRLRLNLDLTQHHFLWQSFCPDLLEYTGLSFKQSIKENSTCASCY